MDKNDFLVGPGHMEKVIATAISAYKNLEDNFCLESVILSISMLLMNKDIPKPTALATAEHRAYISYGFLKDTWMESTDMVLKMNTLMYVAHLALVDVYSGKITQDLIAKAIRAVNMYDVMHMFHEPVDASKNETSNNE